MSKKVTENTEKKVLTRYEMKMQKRAEEKKKAEKEKWMSTAGGIVIVVLLACLVASFPIRTYLTVNGTYIKVGGENISRVEFDYNYNIVANSYIAQNGYYLSMFGVNLSGDLSAQMYSDTMSWKDFFEQMTVDSIAGNKALRDQAKAAGFTCDLEQDYAEYMENFRKAAAEEGVTEKEYYKECYGPYATASRLKRFIYESMETSAYYDELAGQKAPSAEEIEAYYAENKDSYDSVDYRLTVVNAQLPTEPTELADPVEETEGAENADENTDAAYQPSAAEIAFAMAEARKEAEEALASISTEGELRENVLMSSLISQLRDWMFDSGRKAADKTIIENETSHLYYVVEFVNRYRDETPTQDARIIIVSADAAVREDAVLEEWKSGEATEDSFAKIADKYAASVSGGLYEGLILSGMPDALAEWLGDSARGKGDTAAITGDEGTASYVVYYVGANEPQWSINIKNTLLQQTLSDYMAGIKESYEVEDPKGNLNYLKIQAALAASGNGGDATSESGDAQ